MGLARPYVPVSQISDLIVEYIQWDLDNMTFRCHWLNKDTSMVAQVILAIEDYLTVGVPTGPLCKAIGEEGEPGEPTCLAETRTTLTGTRTAPSKILPSG